MTPAQSALLDNLIAQAQGNVDFLTEFLALTGQSPQIQAARNSANIYLSALKAQLPA